MSWSASNLTTNNYVIAISGSIAICGNTLISSFRSTDAGQTWNQIVSGPPSGMNAITIDGTNGIGLLLNSGTTTVYYTTDGGTSYTASSTPFAIGQHRALAMMGNNAILGRSNGLFYSTNAGQTWTVSNQPSGNFTIVAMGNSLNAVAVLANMGIYYTTDGGATWNQSSQTTGNYQALAMSGANAIATLNSGGMYYSTNSGQTWAQSNVISGTPNQLAINSTGQAIASANNLAIGIYYSTNGGQTWSVSNAVTDRYVMSITNTGAIAGAVPSAAGSGMYYSTNGGQNWTLSDYTSQKFNAVILSGSNAIASVFNGGIAYSTGPLCFHRDTLVLCEGNVHRPIHELQPGDRVLTHRHGPVSIKHIGTATLHNGLFSKPSTFLYRHKQSGLQVSGEHRMLVEPDAFPEEARDEQKKKYGLEEEVDGLLMWMACLHPDFERVEESGAFPMCHLVLEHDNEPMRHYGIFVTDYNLVTETCHEADFHKFHRVKK